VTRRSDQTHQADFNDTLFLATELSRATWLVATFATKAWQYPREPATSTRFAAATNPIADAVSISIESSSASAQLFARDNCEPRSKNAL